MLLSNLICCLISSKAQKSEIKNVIRRSSCFYELEWKMGCMPEKVIFALQSSHQVVMMTDNHNNYGMENHWAVRTMH